MVLQFKFINMTQSKFTYFFIAFIFFLRVNAQDTLTHNLLWEIKHPNQKQSSYLFGTIHLIPTEDFFYPKNTLEKMSLCEKVFFEVDVEKMNDMSTILTLMDKIMMSDGSSLQDHLEENKYQTIKNYFEKLGLPMMFVDRIKPMFLEILANPEMNPEDLKNNKLKSYEMELATEAKTRKLKIDGLETIDYQISIFDSIPYKKQAEQLYQSIQSSASGDYASELKKLTNYFKAQNLNALTQSIEDEDQSMAEHLDLLLNNRNSNWIPIIEKVTAAKPCFFAVGAGHLGGSKGLISLLKKNGFIVTPVN